MKNLQTIINVILGAAVVALFVLQFTGNGTQAAAGNNEISGTDTVSRAPSGSIAYFNIDSVLANWDLFYEMQAELDTKQQQMESEFTSKTQAFQKRVQDAQYKMQRGLVTRAEAEQLQQQLATEEQSLMNLQNDFAMRIQEEGVVKNRQMIDRIEKFLKEYNQSKGYDYIFTYSFGGNLLYGDDALDITDEVVKGLNKTYPDEE